MSETEVRAAPGTATVCNAYELYSCRIRLGSCIINRFYKVIFAAKLSWLVSYFPQRSDAWALEERAHAGRRARAACSVARRRGSAGAALPCSLAARGSRFLRRRRCNTGGGARHALAHYTCRAGARPARGRERWWRGRWLRRCFCFWWWWWRRRRRRRRRRWRWRWRRRWQQSPRAARLHRCAAAPAAAAVARPRARGLGARAALRSFQRGAARR